MVYIPLPLPSGFPMPKSRLVQVSENQILLPEDYHVYMPKDYLLVITKLFSTQHAVIDIAELRVLQNTIQRKSIVPTIITVLSWTPEREQELANGNGKTRKKSKAKNGSKTTLQPPRTTILNFIKKKVVVVQQTQPQPQTQTTQQNQQQ